MPPRPSPARKLLAQRRAACPGVGPWLETHPEALDFVRTWLEMRGEGATDWGARRVVEHLQGAHAFPFSSQTALWAWCRRTWPTLAAEAWGR